MKKYTKEKYCSVPVELLDKLDETLNELIRTVQEDVKKKSLIAALKGEKKPKEKWMLGMDQGWNDALDRAIELVEEKL